MPRRLPEVLTRDEAQRLLRMPNPRYPTGARDLCMLKLMLNSGLRAAEVLNLAWKDVDLHTGRLTVRQGKGKKDRYTILSQRLLGELRRYKQAYQPVSWVFFWQEQKLPFGHLRRTESLQPSQAEKRH
jgi:integrase/recombinase XerD